MFLFSFHYELLKAIFEAVFRNYVLWKTLLFITEYSKNLIQT